MRRLIASALCALLLLSAAPSLATAEAAAAAVIAAGQAAEELATADAEAGKDAAGELAEAGTGQDAAGPAVAAEVEREADESAVEAGPDAAADKGSAEAEPGQDAQGAAASAEAGPEFDGYLVKLRDGVSPAAAPSDWPSVSAFALPSVMALDTPLLSAFDASPRQVAEGIYLAGSEAAALALADAGDIEYIEPNYRIYPLDGYTPSHWSTSAINARAAWDAGIDGTGVKVAIIDTGVFAGHEDLRSDHILPMFNTIKDGKEATIFNGHGTFVAGVVAARVNNAQSGVPVVDGVAPGVEILPIRVFDSKGAGNVSNLLDAIYHAISAECDVINMSVGLADYSPALRLACDEATAAGILLVAAAGNDGEKKDDKGNPVGDKYLYPASYNSVVSVAAAQSDKTRASFSQYNDQVTVTAPGASLPGLGINSRTHYLYGSGTSYAAPFVTGMAALLKEQNPSVDLAIFQRLLAASAVDLGPEGRDDQYGYGLIDIGAFTDLITKNYTINYSDAGAPGDKTGWPAVGSYRLATTAAAPYTLPTPLSNSHEFLGWYERADLSGQALTALPIGSYGDIELWSAWRPKTGQISLDVASVTVAGIQAAPRNDNSYTFDATVPWRGGGIAAGDIEIICAAAAAMVEGPIRVSGVSGSLGNTSLWKFKFTVKAGGEEREYFIEITMAANQAPVIKAGFNALSAVVTPPSLDGNKKAQPYIADVSDWFTDQESNSLTYELRSGGELASAFDQATGAFTYIPGIMDAGSRREFRFAAHDSLFYSAEVTLTIDVADLPLSDSLLAATTAVFDQGAPAPIEVGLKLYGNSVFALTATGPNGAVTPLSLGTDYQLKATTGMDFYAAELTQAYLSSLTAGDYGIDFTFSAGMGQRLSLTVRSAVTLPAAGGGGGGGGGGLIVPITPPVAQVPVVTAPAPLPATPAVSLPAAGQAGGRQDVYEAFDDVTAGSWFGAAVKFVYDRGLFGGVGGRAFEPNGLMSRAMLASVLSRLSVGEPSWPGAKADATGNFLDVPPTSWYAGPVEWAIGAGLMGSVGGGRFGPEQDITREQLASILLRYARAVGWETSFEAEATTKFPDAGDISSWAGDACRWAVGQGLLAGRNGGRLEPTASATRAEVAAILMRFTLLTEK
ncbi:MAG: S8 family serine peptidase [Peptococcaceae bacterium]|jgi:subtilisin family serine protease|nr:S8 family serine peptidase [Peptococcaceae bacterium]